MNYLIEIDQYTDIVLILYIFCAKIFKFDMRIYI